MERYGEAVIARLVSGTRWRVSRIRWWPKWTCCVLLHHPTNQIKNPTSNLYQFRGNHLKMTSHQYGNRNFNGKNWSSPSLVLKFAICWHRKIRQTNNWEAEPCPTKRIEETENWTKNPQLRKASKSHYKKKTGSNLHVFLPWATRRCAAFCVAWRSLSHARRKAWRKKKHVPCNCHCCCPPKLTDRMHKGK